MSKSKKKNIKVRDLNPKKDAKGGSTRQQGAAPTGSSMTGAPVQGAAPTGSSMTGIGKNIN
jgi:hypothetical protein